MDQRNSDGVPWDAALEYHLTEAIMQGTAWLLSDESARRLTSLCVTRRCKESIDQAFHYRPSSPSITVHPPELPRADPTFFVRAHTFSALPSRKALHRWLLLHPKGTTFTWEEDASCHIDNVWLSGEGAGFFEETRSFVESRGMKVMRRR